MAIAIECVDLVKQYGPATVLDHVSWSVAPGGLVGLVGGSGAGKTTLLRIIAGLEPPTSGNVLLRDPAATGRQKPARVGMVFQNLALWPHLSARRHLLAVLGPVLPRRQRWERAEAVLRQVRLPKEAWDHRPGELSGGEAQRLALARALAPEPDVLLLDEPLAQVDTPLRDELLELIGELIRAREVTAVYVTHHPDEAMAVSDRVAVLHRGRLAMDAPWEEAFWRPAGPEAARLTGPVVALPGDLVASGMVTYHPSSASGPAAAGPGPSGRRNRLEVRPQEVRLVEPAGANRWTVIECRPQGPGWRLVLEREKWRVQVPSARPMEPGQTTGIEVGSPTRAG